MRREKKYYKNVCYINIISAVCASERYVNCGTRNIIIILYMISYTARTLSYRTQCTLTRLTASCLEIAVIKARGTCRHERVRLTGEIIHWSRVIALGRRDNCSGARVI